MEFPKPPKAILEAWSPMFIPCPEVKEWAFSQFIQEGAPLRNEDHEHLEEAKILFLWASYPEKRNDKQVVGTAQLYMEQTTKWSQGKTAYAVRQWFGETPDFIITLCAPYCQEASPESICALIEHELYHCGQEKDEFGFPKYTKEGMPKFAMHGHDVEEFLGVIKRYGAFSPELQKLQEALSRSPEIKRTDSYGAICGCGAGVA